MSTTQNRNLIRLNTGAADGSLFTRGFHNTFYIRQPWTIRTDRVRSRERDDVLSTVTLGMPLNYQYKKEGALLEDTFIELTLSAVTPAGVGTYARYVDFLGYAILKKLTLLSSQNLLEEKTGVDMFIKHIRDYGYLTSDIYDAMVQGNLTAAQRNTNAAAANVIKIPLKYFWDGLPCHTPVITALAQELRIKLDLGAVNEIVQTDYTNGASVTVTGARFIHEYINFTGQDRDQATAPTMSARGTTFLIEQTNNGSMGYYTLASGGTKFTVPFTGFTAPWHSIYIPLQKAADVTTPYAKKPFELSLADFNNIKSIQLREGNVIIQDYTNVQEIAERWCKYHMKGKWRFPLIFFTVSEYADIKNEANGSLNASNMNNFNMVIEFKAALGQDYVIYPVLFEHNWVNHQAGEMQRAFQN